MTDATDLPFYPSDVRPRRRPVTSHPTLRGSGVTRLDSTQGQDLVVILDGRLGGNVEGSPLCQLGVIMEPGKVSTPHVHDETHVYVRLEECGPQGVLTLYGDALENEEWLFAGGTLWVPPGVPHVAIYPRYTDRRFDSADYVDAPTAVAVETRTTPDPFADVRALPELWGSLARNLNVLGLYDHVDVPAQAGDAWRINEVR